MLPLELIPDLCDHLDIQSLVNLSQTNREWQSLISDLDFKNVLQKHCPWYELDRSPRSSWLQCAIVFLARKTCSLDTITKPMLQTRQWPVTADASLPLPQDFECLSLTKDDPMVAFGQSVDVTESTLVFPQLHCQVELTASQVGTADGRREIRDTDTNPDIYTSTCGISLKVPNWREIHVKESSSPQVLVLMLTWGFGRPTLLVKYRDSEGLEPDYKSDVLGQLDHAYVCGSHVFVRRVQNWTYILCGQTFQLVCHSSGEHLDYVSSLLTWDGLLIYFGNHSTKTIHKDMCEDQDGSGHARIRKSLSRSWLASADRIYSVVQSRNSRYAVLWDVTRHVSGVWDLATNEFMKRPYFGTGQMLVVVGLSGGEVHWWGFSLDFFRAHLKQNHGVELDIEEDTGYDDLG